VEEMAEERARATKGTERGGGGEGEKEQDAGLLGFICPITAEVMMDPVITCDGQTYERQAIEKWFQRGNLTSPMTGLALPTTVVTPNHALREAMEEYFPKMTAIQNKVFEIGEEASIVQMELNFNKRKVEFLSERQDRLTKSRPYPSVAEEKNSHKDGDEKPFKIIMSKFQMSLAGRSPAQIRDKLPKKEKQVLVSPLTKGFQARQFLNVGYSVRDLRQAGCSAGQMYSAGCKISKLRRGGYSDKEIKGAGFQKSALSGAGIK
jgi:hypothetical protein